MGQFGMTNKAAEMTEGTLQTILDWGYDTALDGSVPGFDSAEELAASYMREKATLVDQVNSLIAWQNTKAATTGFVTGLGGLVTLPVAVPANISIVLLVQIRMVAAIAIMGGHDVNDDRVKTLAYACLAGNSVKELLRTGGIRLGEKLAVSAIKSLSRETLKTINRAVGFRLLTKFGEKGILNLGKAVPLVGGVVSATIEAVATNAVGNAARNAFIAKPGKVVLSSD